MNNNKKTAFITGVCGQTGSHLADFLLEKGYFVVGLRRRSSTFNTKNVEHLYDNPNFIMEWGDVTDIPNLYRIINKHKPEEIYHLASQSHVRLSFDLSTETFNSVAGGTLNLLNVVKDTIPKTKIYVAGSSEMFGDNPNFPQDEETKFMPASPYACSKVFAANISRNYRESYNMFICVGILFNHEGPRRSENFVTRKITRAAARIKLGLQDKLELGNLDSKRDWGLASEYVEAMWLMLQQNKADDYVISTGETHTVKEFLEETFKLAGLKIEDHVVINERFFRPQEVPVLLGNSAKAKRELGWEPKVKFKKLVQIMYESDLKEQKKLIP